MLVQGEKGQKEVKKVENCRYVVFALLFRCYCVVGMTARGGIDTAKKSEKS